MSRQSLRPRLPSRRHRSPDAAICGSSRLGDLCHSRHVCRAIAIYLLVKRRLRTEAPLPLHESAALEAFGETRLRQVARLAALERAHTDALNDLGSVVVTRAMITLLKDCIAAGIDEHRVVAALRPA